MSCKPTDCSASLAAPLEPYGDISGIGVLIGFVGTGGFILVFVVLHYLLAFDPRADLFDNSMFGTGFTVAPAESAMRKPVGRGKWRANPIDVMVVEGFRRLTHLGDCSGRFSNLEQVIQEVKGLPQKIKSVMKRDTNADTCKRWPQSVLHLCDLQILSGLAILVAGYMSLSCGLASYHWQMIAYLAWFSCLTHQGGLMVLRPYLVQHSIRRIVRLILMSALFVLLLVALVPTGRFDWNASSLAHLLHSDRSNEDGRWHAGDIASNALCYFPGAKGGTAATSADAGTTASHLMMFSVLLLSHGFFNRTMKLFQPISQGLVQGLRQPLSNFLQTLLSKTLPRGDYCMHTIDTSTLTFWQIRWRAVRRNFLFPQSLSIFIALRFHMDFYVSMVGEIYWLTMTMAWGLMQLIKTRAQPDPAFLKLENQWTFGQIIPVVLLAAPILTTVGMIGANRDDNRHQLSASPCNSQYSLRPGSEPRIFDGSCRGASTFPLNKAEEMSSSSATNSPTTNAGYPCNFSDPFISNLMMEHCYAAGWIDIYMAINAFVIIFLTACAFGLTFGYDTMTQAVGESQADVDIQEIWLNRNGFANYGIVPYIVLSHTSACTTSGLLALTLARWLRGRDRLRRGLKRAFLALLLVGVHAVYIYAWLGAFDLAERVGLQRDAGLEESNFVKSMGSSIIVAIMTTTALHMAVTLICIPLGWAMDFWFKKGELDER